MLSKESMAMMAEDTGIKGMRNCGCKGLEKGLLIAGPGVLELKWVVG